MLFAWRRDDVLFLTGLLRPSAKPTQSRCGTTEGAETLASARAIPRSEGLHR